MEEISSCRDAQLCAKGLAYSWLRLVLLFLTYLAACTQGCPSSCECQMSNRTVACRGRGLTAVPEGVPSETRVLDLSENLLTSVRPGELGELSWLEELDLSDNFISHLEPGVLAGLPSLRMLRLMNNRLKTIWPGVLGAAPNLTALDVGGNPLAVLLDETFAGELASLRQLELGEDLVYVAPRAFIGLRGLQHLTLGKANSSTFPTAALAVLGNLTALRFRGLKAAVLQDNSFQRLRKLQVLEIERWPRLGTLTPDSLHGLNLTSLSVTRCNLSSVPYAALGHMVYLQSLDLSYNPITEIRGDLLDQLARLRELRLVGGHLSAIQPSAFWGLVRLEALSVSGNQLRTLEESAFHPSGDLATLQLDDNPLVCDCRLLWLVAGRGRPSFGERQPVCASPPSAQGMAFEDFGDVLPPGSFTCRPARILSEVAQVAAVAEGETVSFQCRAEGEPAPAVQWTTPQQRVLSSGQRGRIRVGSDGTLEIWYAQAQDGGTYRCEASNAAGADTISALLRVRGFAPSATLNPSPRTLASHGLGAAPLGAALDRRVLWVVITMGSVTFLGVVGLCFTLLLVWSRVKGPVKHTSDVEMMQSSGTDAQSEAIKYTTKMF